MDRVTLQLPADDRVDVSSVSSGFVPPYEATQTRTQSVRDSCLFGVDVGSNLFRVIIGPDL